MAEPIVQRALLAIREHSVRFRRFLEPLLGLAVARIAIGVVPQRQLAVGTFDLLVRRFALDRENLVVVPLAPPLATFPIAGRSSRSPSM